MKLLRLKVNEPFRSLQEGFELHFQQDWKFAENKTTPAFDISPFILAGPNGSGKSNVLEVLAAIFFNLEFTHLDYRPQTTLEGEGEEQVDILESKEATPDAYELEYLIPVELGGSPREYRYAYIKVEKEKGKSPTIEWLNRKDFDRSEQIKLGRTDIPQILPEFVFGYSSGENEILSLPFFKLRFVQFDEYLDGLRNQTPYSGRPESRHVYLDTEFNQAILLCNLIFEDEDSLEPFNKEVGIEGLRQFRIIIRQHKRFELSSELISSLSQKDREDPDKTTSELTTLLQARDEEFGDKKVIKSGVIDRLKNCATCSYYDDETDSLYLDYWVTVGTTEAFKNNFATPIELFQGLQVLLTLNLYSVSENLKHDVYESDSLYTKETVPTLPSDERIMRFKDFVLKKKGVNDTFYLKNLSDGEHQFLHSLGLCLLFKDTNSLFLLDEPETHFNPEWRSRFITRLRDCFKRAANDTQRELLISTHTPFLISDSKKEQVLVFKKEKNIVEVNRPEYNTLGASVDQITMLTFDKPETIGGYAEEKLKELQYRFEAGEDKKSLIKEINKQLGDSVEKMLLIRNILDSMGEGED